MKDVLYIVMPAYNEEANIKDVVQAWYPLLEEKNNASRLVVADKGSKDKTHNILLNLQKEYPQLITLDTKYKEHGPKVIALYDYAIKQNADYVFQTDSDGQTNPNEFKKFWELRNKYDGIFGCRPNREDGKSRAFVEQVVCKLLKLYFHVSVKDANAPFRLYKTEILQKFLYKLPEDFNIPNIMITTYFEYYNCDNKFIDISFKPREMGTNSINLKKIVNIGIKALKDFHTLKKQM